MWDDARNYAPQVWANFPKSVRIAALSEHLANVTRRAGFQVLDLKYYKDPAQFPPVQWQGERVLFYWNRTGMVGPGFLEKLCHALSVDRLIFRGDIDPIFGESIRYRLPEHLNGTSVETLPFLQSKEAYYRALDRANLVIAPRLSEGIGMVFLEALARGCAVFAADSATMNEYITHGEDGYLLPSLSVSPEERQAPGFAKRVLANFPITDLQNWEEIAQLDVARVGKTARENHAAGFTRWKASLPDFARFITEWNC
jgi:glycosyltransferase involved in cell wall biosynthesis